MNPPAFPIMIDSGAYSAWTKGSVINLDEYIAFCHEILEDHPQAVCVNLDVIGDGKGSYRNWKIMREAGLPNTLPVYHVISDVKWLERYLAQTNHVGLGAIVNMSNARRKDSLDRVWEDYLIDKRTRMPKVKAHGMGITSFPLMKRYPWHSVDSTAWIKVAMFGHILVPKRRRGGWDYTAMPTKIGFSTKNSDRRERGKHYHNLPPTEKAVLLRYLKERGIHLGFEARVTEGGKATFRGVSTLFGDRANLCTEFYAQFLAQFPWPRPFRTTRTGFGM